MATGAPASQNPAYRPPHHRTLRHVVHAPCVRPIDYVLAVPNERFSLRSLYLYTVCLATLLISIFSVSSAVRSSVDLAYPDPYMEMPVPVGDDLTADEIELRERDLELSRRAQRRYAVLDLIRSTTLVLVAAPAYFYHWRRAQRDRREGRDETPTT